MPSSARGLRALWVSFAVLAATAVAQAALVSVTGSVALLGDTLHNVTDALTAVPLGIAFLLGRRAASKRFTYGLGRAVDLAGLVILAVIAASAVLTGWQAIARLLSPQPVSGVWWLALAGVIGFAGNEAVARYRIRVGRSIGSAALVADGVHARTDGFTSLAVVIAAAGTAIGWPWLDPVVGLAIAVAIGWVLVGASREVLRRLLDGVDPALTDQAEEALRSTTGVLSVDRLRLRWIGHRVTAEAEVAVAPDLTLAAAHTIAHDAEHSLRHAVPELTDATIHAHPAMT